MKATPEITAERVNIIAELMRRGDWVRGETGIRLAKDWDLSLSRVEDLSAEAWRRVCHEADDAVQARPTIAGRLSVAVEQAAERKQFRELAQLADTWSRVVGARAPEKSEHVHLTEEQARARYRELTGHDWPGPKEEAK